MPRFISTLATRAFIFAFLPLCLVLLGIVLTIHSTVKTRIRDGLQESIQRSERTLELAKEDLERRNTRLLTQVSEDSGLKAGMGLLREARYGQAPDGRALALINEQVAGLAKSLQYDFVYLIDSEGAPITAFDGQSAKIPLDNITSGLQFFPVMQLRGGFYTGTTVPINVGSENLGAIVFGKKFEMSASENEYEALVHDGNVLLSNLPRSNASELQNQLENKCDKSNRQCEVKLTSENFIVAPVRRAGLGDKVQLLKLLSIDAATEAFDDGFDRAFLAIGLIGLIFTALLASIGSRSISKPITRLIGQMNESERQGNFQTSFLIPSKITEVRHLEEAFQRAAVAILQSQVDLERSTLDFVESMAQALDARDPYTAGHSNRVSVNSVTLAEAMGLSPDEVEVVRIGAKLHDIGKIGIPDTVLQKPGALSAEEFAMIRMHPQIGRRILERAKRFEAYLPIVELHHENVDGTGYPYGLRGSDLPLGVKIVHVIDVYDAITSNRAYRDAMPEEQVMKILLQGSGRMFDPEVLEVFLSILKDKKVLDMEIEQRMLIDAET